jgi:fatty-acyl-CoA synthase
VTPASYVCGSGDSPLLYQSIGDTLRQAVDCCSAEDAVVSCGQGIRLSYQELHDRSEALAAGLLALGIEPGDRVGVWSGNAAEWVISLCATALSNMILVPVNPDYRAGELAFALGKVGVRALIMAKGYKGNDYRGIFEEAAGKITWERGRIQSSALPKLERIIFLGVDGPPYSLDFNEIGARRTAATESRLAGIIASTRPDDPVNIQFTSGTTGRPKGATLSHYNLVNNANLIVHGLRLGLKDRMCVPVPLYHCFGLVLGALAAILAKAALVLPSHEFDPLTTLQAVAKERCTSLYGVPTMFIAQLNHSSFAEYDLSSLRTGIIGGAPCPIEVVRRLVKDMNLRDLTIAFGMTETSPASFLTGIDDPLELRVETVGRVLPYLESKIVNSTGDLLSRGEVGEVLVRGHAVMRGYWDDPEGTAAAIDSSGWMHTGDLGTFDSEGYLRITGRVKDMIIRGGENIYPREVEEFLFTHPDILSAQVFGVPSDYYGEEVCAWIIPKDGKSLRCEDVQEYCFDRIARHKVPTHVYFVTAFPLTVTGKPQKIVMRDRMLDILAKAEAG